MSNKVDVIDVSTNVKQTEIEYIYVTIPAEYVCVYHRILAMLSDYGIEMLKDCKATCTDRNSGVIECFNMFNAAVAARKLGQGNADSKYTKLAATIIKYVKAKINQIYKGKDNSTSFVFPVDETGELKAFVSCNDTPKFLINPEDGELFKHKFHLGFDEHFALGDEDLSPNENGVELNATITARYEIQNGRKVPCADVKAWYDEVPIELNRAIVDYYFDDTPVVRFNDVVGFDDTVAHKFTVVVKYNNEIAVAEDIK